MECGLEIKSKDCAVHSLPVSVLLTSTSLRARLLRRLLRGLLRDGHRNRVADIEWAAPST
jgi:hypothetical protein